MRRGRGDFLMKKDKNNSEGDFYPNYWGHSNIKHLRFHPETEELNWEYDEIEFLRFWDKIRLSLIHLINSIIILGIYFIMFFLVHLATCTIRDIVFWITGYILLGIGALRVAFNVSLLLYTFIILYINQLGGFQ